MSLDVNVPASGASGTINITANGTYDVTDKASAVVAVPSASGTKSITITENGTKTENVKDYASASITVNVSKNYYNLVTFAAVPSVGTVVRVSLPDTVTLKNSTDVALFGYVGSDLTTEYAVRGVLTQAASSASSIYVRPSKVFSV